MKNKIYVFIMIALLGVSILGLPYLMYSSCCESEEMRCCEAPGGYYLDGYTCSCAGGELQEQNCEFKPIQQ